jgi:hypothetical protein
MVRRSYSTILVACLVCLGIAKLGGCAVGGNALPGDAKDDELAPFIPGVGPGVGSTDHGAGGFGGGDPGPGGAGGTGSQCAHDPCAPGVALDRTCDPCVELLCADDAFCCNSEWDTSCINMLADYCPGKCEGGAGGAGPSSSGADTSTSSGGSTCAHDLCVEGEALDPTCDACADAVCAADDYCCSTAWDPTCIQAVDSICGPTCGATTTSSTSSGGGGCAHDTCVEGEALDPMCDACAEAVCAADAYCCTTLWDDTCVAEVADFCGAAC